MTEAFIGAKLAILVGDKIVTILRDDFPTIPYPDHWDLPGGGREGNETPQECVLRETFEELGLQFAHDYLLWAYNPPESWFFVTEKPNIDLESIRFGDEGQCWRLADISWFLESARTVPNQPDRLRKYLAVRKRYQR